MAAEWTRNTLDPLQRLVKLIINADGFTPAPRGTDFIALGIVFLGDTSNLVLATGTMTNDRHPLVVADFAITATDQVNDRVTKAAHGLETGDGPFRPTTTAGNLVAGTNYYAIYYDDDQLSWATSPENAYAGTKVDINADVTGMIFQDAPSTSRGIDGRFTYTATQAEADRYVSELGIYVEGNGFRYKNGGGTFSSIGIKPSILAETLEGSVTTGDGLRMVVRGEIAPFEEDEDGNVTIMSLDGSKVSHKGKISETGRSLTEIVDPT